MMIKKSNFAPSRREFLKNALPTGTLFCFGCSSLFALPLTDDKQQSDTEKHPFKQDTGMTVEETYRFSYQHGYIDLLLRLAKEIGREKFVQMLMEISEESDIDLMKNIVQNMRKRDFTMLKIMSKNQTPPYNLAKVSEIVEETDTVYEIKYTECLYARMFRDENAADIGYALECSSSEAFFRTFNPKLKFTNPKNLMKGDDVCIYRWVWEG
jgi:hypothetical protein